MLACMSGNNREIFFPKLKEAQMMTFDTIATALLKEYGYDILECDSDEEAIEKAVELKKGSMVYPVHYSKSNTSGEKEYEEFFTNQENVDMKRFDSLGVITDKRIPDKDKAHNILTELDGAFERTMLTKDDVVQIIKRYLPEFEHIEKGKSLDSKM